MNNSGFFRGIRNTTGVERGTSSTHRSRSGRLLKVTAVFVLFMLVLAGCGGTTSAPTPTPTPTPGTPPTPATGNLKLTITGLPPAVAPNVTVTGPDAYNAQSTSSTTLSNITVGSYTVAASEVSSGSAIYRPDEGSVSVLVTEDATAEATIDYTAVPGTLKVTIEGTDSNSGDVTISGPDSFNINLGSTHTLTDLHPGEYAISSQNFLTTADRYFLGETFGTIEVKSDQVAEMTVTYAELAAQSFRIVKNNDDDENRQDSLRHALNAAAIDPDIRHIVFSSDLFPEQGGHTSSI